MLQPFLVVGVGGSGGKTVRALRHAIDLTLRRYGWDDGIPDAWQFLHFDSPQAQDGANFPAPFLPKEDYLSLVPGGVDYPGVYQVVKSKLDPKHLPTIERVLPDPAQATINIGIGAGQFRGLGKAIAYASLDQMASKAKFAIGKMRSNRASAQLVEIDALFGGAGGGVGDPMMVIVSSIAGGSGAGQFMEVIEAVKAAIGDEPWANQSASFLYAPDVFDNLGAMGGAIAPNSLYALSETMNAIWANAPTEAIKEIYKNHGLFPGASEAYRVGAKYNHIIGRTSNTVDLDGPEDVYMAVGDFMATWITNPGLQDQLNVGYFGNWDSRATAVQDKTELKLPVEMPTPFSSFGYGKVSLGLDQFENYAAERIARSVIHNLLNRHLAQDPGCNMKSEQAWVEDLAGSSKDDFFGDTRLYKQKGSNGFDIYTDLSPSPSEMQALEGQLNSFISQQSLTGMPTGGHAPGVWVQIIQNSLQNLKPTLTQQFADKVALRAKQEWVPTAPDRIMGVVGTSLAQKGLPVTVELLSMLRKKNGDTSAELRKRMEEYRNWEAGSNARMIPLMGPAQTMQKVPPTNPAVGNCIREAEDSLKNLFYATVLESGAVLLDDFTDNFLAPLLQSLEAMKVKLTEAAKDNQLPDGRQNPYFSWPSETGQTPSRFKPAPNVALLINHLDYPKEFDSLTRDTFGAFANPGQLILDEVCMGSKHIEGATVNPKHAWALLEQIRFWVPSERQFQTLVSSPQKSTFRTTDDIMSYYEVAKDWLEIGGRPFRAFFNQNLAEFLEGNNNPLVQAERNATFIEGFSKAAASSDPLVRLNSALLQATHGVDSDKQEVVISDIPVSVGTALYEQMKNVLQNNGLWKDKESDKRFKGPNSPSAATTSEVFIAKMLAFPVHPLAMGSVVSPIASHWLKASTQPVSRQTFMQWRQGRSLVESIPAAQKVWKQMLRGWHLARLLNLLQQFHGDSLAETQAKGVKLSIWVDGGQKYVDFPHPLFSAQPAKVIDYPAVVLQSLKVALLDCYAQSSLAPLEPYKHLFHLGQNGIGTDISPLLSSWIQSASLAPDQPIPDSDRAGSEGDDISVRKERSVKFLLEELKDLQDEMAKLDKFASSRTYPLIWEIRTELEESLEDAIRIVESIKPARRF